MKRHVSMWIGLAAVAAWIAAAPAAAQDRAGASPPSSGGGGGATASAPSGGAGGGTTSSGGGGGGGFDRAGAGSSSFGGGNRGEAGGHGGATGGSGVAMPRGDHSVGRYTEGSSSGRSNAGRDGERAGVPEYSRPREGAPRTGTAVPRPAGSTPPTTGGGTIIVPGGGYYGGSGYGYPYGNYYGGYYSGYYDPFYDPWYGGYYPSYGGGYGGGGGYSQSSGYAVGNDDGALRLKIKPRDAEVYVDGYYVGVVDEFDGMFQRLHIEPGAHRVEVRAAGFEPLVFEVKISPEHTTTYQGEMKKAQ
jgi:PEGA domain-containing protein